MIQDSGARHEFESGAVRDIQEGKGRCDLLPLKTVADIYFYTTDSQDENHAISVFQNLDTFYRIGNKEELVSALTAFCAQRGWDLPSCLLEVAKHYEEGCEKYGERNWEKGIPCHCYLDSAVRHYLKYLRGDNDERHDRAFVWNILGLMWTLDNKPELNDLQKKDYTEYCDRVF